MKDERSKLEIKYASLKRLLIWHFFSKSKDIVLVSEYPKSGGTWLCQLLAECLDLPYQRNITPEIATSILHGHHPFSKNFNSPICMVRDGRDIVISYYFYLFFKSNPKRSKRLADKLNFKEIDDVKGNLGEFIKYLFEEHTIGGKQLNWSRFVESYQNNSSFMVKYEDLLNNGLIELKRIFEAFDFRVSDDQIQKALDKYSFENQSKRKRGEEQKEHFLRKGIAGDWKNYFDSKSSSVFKTYASDTLISLGYEKDSNW